MQVTLCQATVCIALHYSSAAAPAAPVRMTERRGAAPDDLACIPPATHNSYSTAR